MRRFPIFLLCLAALAVPAIAWAVSTSGNLAITVTAPPTAPKSACPQGTADPNDGCQLAQATSSFRRSNFFTGYTGQNYGANRPSWNVAGVDYPVGYDTTVTLLDPSVAGNLPACASYSSNTVTINSAPCTIQHLDFSLHSGICLLTRSGITNGQTIMITNNKFSTCNGTQGVVTFVGGPYNALFQYNEVDSSLSAQTQAVLQFYITGTLNAQYNAFFNINKDTFHGAANNVVTKYNYAETMGSPSAHANYTVVDGNMNWDSQYETVLNTSAGCCTTAFCYFAPNSGLTMGTATCSNNVLVSRPGGSSGNPTARLIDVGYPGVTISNLFLQNNYLDATGTGGGGWLVNEGGTITSATCNNNKSMINGAVQTGRFGSTSNLFTCS